MIIEEEHGKSIKLNYRGPVSEVKETLNNVVLKVFGDKFSLEKDGQVIVMKNVKAINSNQTIQSEREDDESYDNNGNKEISSD